MVSEILRWYRLYGEPPASSQWNSTQITKCPGKVDEIMRRHREDGPWPSQTGVQYYFGNWNGALYAAGFEPRAPGKKDPIRRVCSPWARAWPAKAKARKKGRGPKPEPKPEPKPLTEHQLLIGRLIANMERLRPFAGMRAVREMEAEREAARLR